MLAAITPIRRILGFVQFMTPDEDQHGWRMLLDTDRMMEYIRLLRASGASPSTAKNYCDKILLLQKLAETYFFDHQGMPDDPHQVSINPLET